LEVRPIREREGVVSIVMQMRGGSVGCDEAESERAVSEMRQCAWMMDARLEAPEFTDAHA
jgi:hypothetical protein